MATRLTKVPRLEGGRYSALRVLRFVRSLIAAEPKRLYMGAWLLRWRQQPDEYNDLPNCGTVACVGGWINIVTGHKEGNKADRAIFSMRPDPGIRAIQHLGLSTGERDACGSYQVSGAASDLVKLFSETHFSDKQVVRRLDAIMKKRKRELSRAIAKVAEPRR